MGETVSIDPARAIRLSRACLEAAVHIRRETELLSFELRELGEDTTVLLPGLQASEWAAGGTRRIAAVVEAVVSWTAVLPGSCPAWSTPAGRIGDDAAASSAAVDALEALRDGDLTRFVQVTRDWSDNEAFAVALGSALGVGDVAPWLAMAADPEAHVAHLDDGSTPLDVVGLLATALAAATVRGVESFSLAELLDEGSSDELTPVGAAMLFAVPGAAGRAWSRSWLVDAMVLVVVPLTAQQRDGDARLVGRRWSDDLVDLRAPILEAVARDPASARAALIAVDLRPLVRASAHYLDGGAAIGELVKSATRPEGLDHGDAAVVMARFIDALSQDDPPPPILAEQLGDIAWPWIGAFRLDRADARPGGLPSPLPGPDAAALRRYVALASSSPTATVDLLGALDVWVAFHLAASGSSPPNPQVLHDLGAVSRFVSEVSRDADRSAATGVDDDRGAAQGLLGMVGNGVGALVGRWWGGAADFAISNIAAPKVVSWVLPDLDAEIAHLASIPASVARDQELLEWQVLSHLWRHRGESSVFDALVPPPSILLDAQDQLRSPAVFDEAAWSAYRAWRDDVADQTGLDNVGAAFGRDLPPSADQGGG